MKAAFGAEAIGLTPADERLLTQLGIVQEIRPKLRPWCALLTGVDRQGRLRREFLTPKIDYARANGRGTRGVWLWWTLAEGCRYQVRERTGTSVEAVADRFITVDADGGIVPTTEEEVRAWLNAASASTS